MKKYMLNLKENEEMMIDNDDQMETIMATFTEAVKDINENDLRAFSNWVKVYKMLNYDIIPDLGIEKVYRINDVVAAVVLKFRGVREFDLLSFNHKEMTVTCLNTKDGKAREYAVRRLLVPTTSEEALMYAKRDLDKEGKEVLVKAFEQIKEHGKEIDVTVAILNNNGLVKLENNKGENKMKETNNNMETTNKTTKTYMDYYNEYRNGGKQVENNENNKGENKMKETNNNMETTNKTTKTYMDYYNEIRTNGKVQETVKETKTTKTYMDYYNEIANKQNQKPETKKVKSMKEILKEMDKNGGRFSLEEVKAAFAAGLY